MPFPNIPTADTDFGNHRFHPAYGFWGSTTDLAELPAKCYATLDDGSAVVSSVAGLGSVQQFSNPGYRAELNGLFQFTPGGAVSRLVEFPTDGSFWGSFSAARRGVDLLYDAEQWVHIGDGRNSQPVNNWSCCCYVTSGAFLPTTVVRPSDGTFRTTYWMVARLLAGELVWHEADSLQWALSQDTHEVIYFDGSTGQWPPPVRRFPATDVKDSHDPNQWWNIYDVREDPFTGEIFVHLAHLANLDGTPRGLGFAGAGSHGYLRYANLNDGTVGELVADWSAYVAFGMGELEFDADAIYSAINVDRPNSTYPGQILRIDKATGAVTVEFSWLGPNFLLSGGLLNYQGTLLAATNFGKIGQRRGGVWTLEDHDTPEAGWGGTGGSAPADISDGSQFDWDHLRLGPVAGGSLYVLTYDDWASSPYDPPVDGPVSFPVGSTYDGTIPVNRSPLMWWLYDHGVIDLPDLTGVVGFTAPGFYGKR